MRLRLACRLLASVGLCVGIGQFAAAADLGGVPVYKAPPAPTLVDSGWSGFYIGGQIGFGSDHVHWDNIGPSAAFSPLGSGTGSHNSGVIGGGQVGYNFQNGNFVFGLEASLSAASFDGTFTSPYSPSGQFSSRVPWLGTVTGRIGYAVGPLLPYIKGGFATGEVDTTLRDSALGTFTSSSAQHYGWTAGGGIEYKLTDRLSLGLEYLYTDLGHKTDINGPQTSIATGGAVPGTVESYSVGTHTQSVMGRLNYRFGW